MRLNAAAATFVALTTIVLFTWMLQRSGGSMICNEPVCYESECVEDEDCPIDCPCEEGWCSPRSES